MTPRASTVAAHDASFGTVATRRSDAPEPPPSGAASAGSRAARTRGPRRRRRRRFSLNGLAIQLSAFAISSTLVALLVVTGSQAAFVEENQSVTEHVSVGGAEETTSRPRPGRSAGPASTGSLTPSAEIVPPPAPGSSGPSSAEGSLPPATRTSATPATDVPEPATTIELTDSDAGTALFSEGTVLAPGMALERCIAVTYEGNADPDPVLLYAATADGALTPYLDLTIEMGRASGDSFGSCRAFVPGATLHRGTLAAFADEHPGARNGLRTWDPAAAGETRSFRFRITVHDDPAASGLAAAFGFTWESRAG